MGDLIAELRTGRFTGTPFEVSAVAETLDPVTTMGVLRLLPEVLLADADTLGVLGLLPPTTLEAYEGVFHRGEASCFPALMQAPEAGRAA